VFKNVGNKIKILAQVMFYLMLAGAAIGGLALIASDDDLIAIGLAIIAGGFIFAWLSSVFIYGFGELIDKTAAIERNTRAEGKSEYEVRVTSQRNDQIDRLRSMGLISEEEYLNLITRK